MDHQNQPQPRQICCRQSWSWAGDIGEIQICLHVIMLVYAILLLDSASYTDDKGLSKVTSTGTMDRNHLSIVIVIGMFCLLFSIAGIVTGLLLIIGANEKNVQYLNIWIGFAMAVCIWNILLAVMFHAIFSVIYVVLCTAMYGFGLLVVIILRSEIYNGVYEKNRNTIMMPMLIRV